MNRRLLLVDDAAEVRVIAALSLARIAGWEVVEASCGAEALAALTAGGPFDAVLLDVMMPGMDGPSTLARLRTQGLPEAVPVVFLTAKPQSAELRRLGELGAAGVIGKPFDPLTLPRELDELIGRRGS